jgi:hypothetical protein
MTPRLRSLGVVALAAPLLGLASCSSVQSAEACPGPDCPAELAAVADGVAATDGVVELVSVTRSSHLEKGTSGGVSVVAVASGADDAATLARRLAEVYLAGDLDPVDRVLVDVRPTPGVTSPDEQEGWQGGTASTASEVPCAPTECSGELEELRAAVLDEFGADLAVDAATWNPDLSPPVTLVECTIAASSVDQSEVNEIARRLATVAADVGALEWGDFRWALSFSRSTVFSFTFDGETGRMLS